MSRKSYVDSWAKFRVATEHVALSLKVLSSDVSDAGDSTDASGSNYAVSTDISSRLVDLPKYRRPSVWQACRF